MSLSKALARADDDIDWDSLAKSVITTGLGEIPYVGSILSALADILWPSGDDVWTEIKDKVEALIKEKISELVYKQVQNSLKGLKNNIDELHLCCQNWRASVYFVTEMDCHKCPVPTRPTKLPKQGL